MRRWFNLLFAGMIGVLLTGCTPKMTERQVFAMDTIMSLKFYGDGKTSSAEEVMDLLVERIYGLDEMLAVTQESSDIHTINKNCGQVVSVSEETANLIQEALTICAKTDGKLDISAYSAVQAWGFTTGSYQIPNAEELQRLVNQIDYTQIDVTETTVFLPEGMRLDLGSVAKGYTGAVLSQELQDMGITSACLTLGGNVQTVGKKPDGTPWRVGIQDPTSSEPLGIVEVEHEAVITSGDYQRYFEQDGVRYCHIIDPDTAAPARSGLSSVTIIGEDGLYCDALSTALFVMGLDDAIAFWRANRDFEGIFVSENGEVSITAGLVERFTLSEQYPYAGVTVFE